MEGKALSTSELECWSLSLHRNQNPVVVREMRKEEKGATVNLNGLVVSKPQYKFSIELPR